MDHPGEFIREEILHELHLPVTRAAEILGVRRATLSDLANGKAALSPEMALRIEKAFGVSMDTLLRMQAWHDTTPCASAPARSTSSATSLRESGHDPGSHPCRPAVAAVRIRHE